ncbi:MAG: hypothetical protein PHE84_03640 [bacterium]|nr:hypothetical protein [bacterium]
MKIKSNLKITVIFLLLALGPLLLLKIKSTPADDALGKNGFGYLTGLKGEYYDLWDARYPVLARSTRGSGSQDPWAGSGGNSEAGCPSHMNTVAATKEDGIEAYVNTRRDNILTLTNFYASRYGSPAVTDAVAWVRFMCRQQTANTPCRAAGALTPEAADVAYFEYRLKNRSAGAWQSITSLAGCTAANDYTAAGVSLCSVYSCATQPITWDEIKNDFEIRLRVAGDDDAVWHWILWDVGYLEVISAPMFRGARVDQLVDFGSGYTIDWRSDGGPANILLQRSSKTKAAVSATLASNVTAANAADGNSISSYWQDDATSSTSEYWIESFASDQYINSVKVYWYGHVGAGPGRRVELYYCSKQGTTCTTPTEGTSTQAAVEAAGWSWLQEIPYLGSSSDPELGRSLEQTYNFPTVRTQQIMLIAFTATTEQFGFWEVRSYPESYDYFEARWIGEINFATADTRRLCMITDAGGRLYIDENLRINAWDTITTTPTKNYDATPPTLEDGWHTVRMEYYEWTGTAAARLGECSDGTCTNCNAIPNSRLRASWEAPTNFDFLGGWFASFWDDPTPTVFNTSTGGDGTWMGYEHQSDINFEWGAGAACPIKASGSGATWNARYTGFIRVAPGGANPPASPTYSLCLTTDGGARLDVNGDGSYEIDTWAAKFVTPPVQRVCANVTFPSAGEYYTVLEYYVNSATNVATLKLEWTPSDSDYLSALDLSVVNDFYLGSDANTRLLYHFSEGAGTSLADSATGGTPVNDVGTITGGAWKSDDVMGELWDGTEVYPAIPKLYFDGAGDYVNAADSNDLDISGPITIEAYIKAEPCVAGIGDYWPVIVHKEVGGDGFRNYGFYIYCPNAGGPGILHYSYRNNVQLTLCGTVSNKGVADGKWHYVAVAAVPKANACYYVDNALDVCQSLATCDNVATTGTALLRVGSGFLGKIDEVRISAVDRSSGGTVSPLLNYGFSPYQDVYAYRVFDSTKKYTLLAGQCLEYDIYMPTTNPTFNAGFDGWFDNGGAGGQTVRDNSGWKDQNCLGAHPATDLSAFANGKWYHRCFNTNSMTGRTLHEVWMGLEGMHYGTYDAMIDNVKITNACTTSNPLTCTPATPVTCVPGTDVYKFYEYGAPISDATNGSAPVASPPVAYSKLTDYPQGIQVMPAQFQYANGLRRFVYNSEFEAYSNTTTAAEPFFSNKVCQGIDNVIDHLWTGATEKPEYAGSATASVSFDRKSVYPNCAGKTRPDHWAIRWEGAIYLTGGSGGTYGFRISANEVGKLTIDNQTLIANCGTVNTNASTTCCTGGTTGVACVPSTYYAFTAGWHNISFELIEGTGAASAKLEMQPNGGAMATVTAKQLAMRQLIPGATKTWGGSGPGYESANVVTLFGDLMDQVGRIFANMGCACSTVFDGSAAEDTQALNALRGLRDYFLARSRIGEIYTGLYYRISSPISRVLEASPFLKKVARTVLNPIVQIARQLESRKAKTPEQIEKK